MAGKIIISNPSGGTPGGNDKEVQFNDAGSFGGGAQLFWDKANDRLGLGDSTPAQQLSLTKCMELLDTTTSAIGIIYKGANRWLHNFRHPTGGGAIPDGKNLFLGKDAGNFTTGGTATSTWHSSKLVGIGHQALQANVKGFECVAIGNQALMSNLDGSRNMAIGTGASQFNTEGSSNMALGRYALLYNVTGSKNSIVGSNAAQGVSGTSIHNNTIVGYQAGLLLTNGGDRNILIGYQAGDNITSGEKNIVIGYDLNALVAANDYQLSIGGAIFGNLGATKRIGINTSTMNETLNVGGAIRLGTSALTNAGAIRWNGSDFEGYMTGWKSLTILKGLNEIFTTRGDILFRGAADPTRLASIAIGASLTSGGVGADPLWYKPMTTTGDLLVEDAVGYAVRLAAGANNQVLTANGAGVKPTWQAAQGGATKEFFVPCTGYGGTNSSMSTIYTYAAVLLTIENDFACINFRVPADFSSITSTAIMVIPKDATATANWDIYSSYGQTGESCTIHTQNNTVSTYSAVIDRVTEVNISGILTSLTANDMVGIKLIQKNNVHDVYVLGIRFKYA